jgi:hypothetical protein
MGHNTRAEAILSEARLREDIMGGNVEAYYEHKREQEQRKMAEDFGVSRTIAGVTAARSLPDQDLRAAVVKPAHYNTGKIEVLEFIEDQQLGFTLGNAVKYICRCRHKGELIKDLEKAIYYLQRELERVKTND